jgi:iron complex outermembrane receptor protein
MSHTAGSKTDVWFASLWGRTAFGLEFRRESILSTVLGLQMDDPKPVRGEDNAVYTHKGLRSHYSFSAEQHIRAGRFRINGGMILHAVQATRNFLQVYPGLDVSFTPVMPFKTFLSVNRAFRLPTFTELYYQSPTNSGNPELQPETAWHAETGAEYRRGPLNARITGFYRYAPESIDWVRLPDEFQWHTENLGQIKTWGIETGIGYKPQDKNGLGKVIDQADLGLRRYYQAHSAGSYYSQYLLDYLRWKITAGMVLRAGERLRFAAQLVWQDRNGTFTYMDSQQNTFEVEYEPFMVVDVKLSYRFRWFSWSVGCNNLLDASYFDLGALPQPGVWFHTGLEVHLTGKQ